MKNYIKKYTEDTTDKIPILKGCNNIQCFCTGECQKIIGFRDKTIYEKMKINVKIW